MSSKVVAPGRTFWRRVGAVAVAGVACASVGFVTWAGLPRANQGVDKRTAAAIRRPAAFYPTTAQWASLGTEPVRETMFRPVYVTDGKIAVNEDQATPIYSPYAGRIMKLLAKPGDRVVRGQPLLVLEATDAVQVHSDFLAAITALNKANAQLKLAQTVEHRLGALYESKAIALKDWQQAQADLISAQNDAGAATAALEAARNRLRILGRTDEEIDKFQERRTITPETPIFSPIDGTVVQRKVGPGQYIASGSADPVFMIGDLSTVWLVAFVRETQAPNVQVGQAVTFKVLAYPDQEFKATVSYVSTALDTSSRRLMVRAVIDNSQGLLRPEMFASVSILTDAGESALSVPRDAVIYEGDLARVWVVRADKGLELRQVKLGLINGRLIEVKDGVHLGESVITKGNLFIDREATGD